MLKKAEKKKLSPGETKEHALYEIHQFYARQHIKRGLGFDELQDQYRIDPGELNILCRDF